MDFFEMESKINTVNKIDFTGEQSEFITYRGDDSVICSSVAGSGKTFSCVHRLKYLLKQGVDPKRMIFFSFTNAAVDELKERIGNDQIKICTIHSFCYSVLASIKRYKEMISIYDFIFWFKKEHEPSNKQQRHAFNRQVETMIEDAEKIGSDISTYKLNTAVGIKTKVPDFFIQYVSYQKTKNKYDFADLLIQTYKATREKIWEEKFAGKYDHVFCDEYQDTSIIQLEILLQLKSKQYYLIGDRNQSIFGFTGTNCNMLEARLKKFRPTIYMNLTNNFRSAKEIVDNSNQFSSLKAIHTKPHEGYIHRTFLEYNELKDLINTETEVAVLVRTNVVIKQLEFMLLKDKVKMRYFNYITKADIEKIQKGDVNYKLQNKLYEILPYFKNEDDLIGFIQTNQESKKFVTSIHKSKGREFETTVLVNSFSEDLIRENGLILDRKELARLTFLPDEKDYEESRNIHYVGITRAKTKLYYAYFPDDGFL